MKSAPLVSIITPSYNQAEYLEATLLSILEQDYPNLEIIVIDGGSTDSSLEVINRYETQLSYWVSEPDHGQADAVNKGLRRARGDFIGWLNSDDLYLPGAVSAAAQILQSQTELGFVFGNALTIDASGKPLNLLRFGDWKLEQLMSFRIICQPAAFMRRQSVLEAGLLDESFHFMLDHHLWLRIAARWPIAHYPQLWAAARHHPSAKNTALSSQFYAETLRLLEWMQTDPIFAADFKKSQRKIEAGAYRLGARYLLDGGEPSPALRAYFHALLRDPAYTLKHWHRMTYALLSLIGLKNSRRFYEHMVSPPDLAGYPELQGWPGLGT